MAILILKCNEAKHHATSTLFSLSEVALWDFPAEEEQLYVKPPLRPDDNNGPMEFLRHAHADYPPSRFYYSEDQLGLRDWDFLKLKWEDLFLSRLLTVHRSQSESPNYLTKGEGSILLVDTAGRHMEMKADFSGEEHSPKRFWMTEKDICLSQAGCVNKESTKLKVAQETREPATAFEAEQTMQ